MNLITKTFRQLTLLNAHAYYVSLLYLVALGSHILCNQVVGSVNQFIYFFACCPAGSLSLYKFSEVGQRDRFHTRISAALSVPGGGGGGGEGVRAHFPNSGWLYFAVSINYHHLLLHTRVHYYKGNIISTNL